MTRIIWENKLKFFISLILIIFAGSLAVLSKGRSQTEETKEPEKKAVSVKVQKAGESQSLRNKIKYPATVSGDQEAKLVAQISGTATAVNFDLGDSVNQGKMLIRIDDQGSALAAGENGFRSGQIQQLENAVAQAEEALDLAKDNYKEDKTDATKSAKDLAKLQLEGARLNLESALNAHQITAPISGTVISRSVSTGDTVSPGQLLAVISKTNKVKVQFYVDKEELKNISLGSSIRVLSGEKEIPAKVINISPQADEVTKRFLIEAMPGESDNLSIGTIVNVVIETHQSSNGNNSLILPLSALNVGQNETSLFMAEDGKAKRIPVEIVKIFGETAEVRADLVPESLIIIEGNKLIKEGDKTVIRN